MLRALKEIADQLTTEIKSAEAPNQLFAASAKVHERRNWTGFGIRQQRQETLNGNIVPRSPFGAVVGLAALMLVARSLCRAN